MRVLCLPLDSRPCNALFPAQLAAWRGDECLLPRPDEMDAFTRPASFKATRAFLERELPRADAAVISVDRLCFGSLLASREEAATGAEALARLDWLASLRRRFPQIPFHGFSVIIRASVSTLASSDLPAYRAMSEYSEWSDIADETGDITARRRAEAARARVPEAALRRYHAVRARNHAVNRRAVELAKAGVFDSLALLMEDAPTHGFHRREQRALLGLAEDDPRVSLRNGADEGGAIGVAKALGGGPGEADVGWLGCPEGRFTARYEDRPFQENMETALRYAGVRVTPGAARTLAVACPPDGEQAECGQTRDPEALAPIAAAVNALIADGRQVYLLDLVSANGGCFALIDRLNDLMDAGMDEKMLKVERETRGCDRIEETAVAARAKILVGKRDDPMKKVIHMFPHCGFNCDHLVQLKKDYPDTDTLLCTISRVYPGNDLIAKAEELGLNFVCGNSHALEIFENGVPMARALKNHLPDVEVVIFRERQTSIPLDEVGSPAIRAYATDIAEKYLHRK